MSTTTNTAATTNAKKPSSRPACFSKKDWENLTFDAYKDLVALVEGKTTGVKFLNRHVQLFKKCGIPADGKHLLSLVIAMAKDTTQDHEKVRKILSISTFRQFFNKTWAEKDAMKVVSDAKARGYKEHAKSTKNGPTKAELAAMNAELAKEIAALKAKLAA